MTQPEPLKIKEPYFTYYIHPITGYAQTLQTKWMNDSTDNTRLKEGRVFTKADEARAAMDREKGK